MKTEKTTFARRGFSLLEMLAVVTILGVVSAIVIPRITVSTLKAKIECCRTYRRDINKAVEQFAFENDQFPSSASQLSNTQYYPEPVPVCPVDGKAYRLSPTTGRVIHTNH